MTFDKAWVQALECIGHVMWWHVVKNKHVSQLQKVQYTRILDSSQDACHHFFFFLKRDLSIETYKLVYLSRSHIR